MNTLNNILEYIRNGRKIDYLIILILGLTTVFWFKDDLVYIGGDAIIPLNPVAGLKYLYLWDSDHTGTTTWGIKLYFFIGFYAFFYKLGLSVSTIQLLYFYFLRVLGGLGMYYLFSNITKENTKENHRVGSIIAAILYMFNPSLAYFYVHISYAVIPAIISFFIVALKSESMKIKIKYALFTSILSFGIVDPLPNYKFPFITIFICLLIIVFYLNLNIVNNIKTAIIFCSVFLLVNLPIMISVYYLIYGKTTQILQAVPLPEQFGDFGYTVMYQVFRLSGHAIAVFGPFYKNPLFVLATYAFVIIALSALIIKPKSKNVIFFSFLAIIGLLFNSGPNPPFAPLFKYLLYNFDILKTFRTVGTVSIITTIAYSILIGITASTIFNCKKINKYMGGLLVLTIVIIILISAYPIVTGSIHDSEYSSYGYVGKKIPESYYKINTIIENDKTDFKTLVIPAQYGYQSSQWDKYYFGPIIYPWIITKPTFYDPLIYWENVTEPSILSELYNTSLQNDTDIYKIASLNIKYILYDGYSCSFPLRCSKNTTSIPGFKKIESIGKLDLYKINDTYFKPHIYATDDLKILNSKIAENETSIIFEKINPSEYLVKVKTNEPFFLVFSEKYDNRWKAYMGKTSWIEALVQIPISEDKHFIANGYANAWFIDKEGDYEITLYFKPQATVYLGVTISMISLIIFIFYIMKKDKSS